MRICFVQNHSANNEGIYLQSLGNHIRYFDSHNYDLYTNMTPYSRSFDPGVFKMLIRKYDYVITVGSDIYFTDLKRPIEDFIDKNFDMMIDFDNNVEYTSVNGDLIIFSTNLSNSFWKLFPLYNNDCTQDFINFISLTDHPGVVNEKHRRQLQKLKERIKIYPPRSMQSFMPYETHLPEERVWHPGDFSVHFHTAGYGCDNNLKFTMMQRFAKEFPAYV